MNKTDAIEVYRWRQTLVDNYEAINKSIKSSNKADLSHQGQLSMFDIGLDDPKAEIKLKTHEGSINVMDYVNKETELLGIPVLYDPLQEYEFYFDIYCTHTPSEILELTEKTEKIVIIDRLSRIENRTSAKGNKYCKLFFSQMGETYIYLWGNLFKDKVNMLFINSILMVELTFNTPTKEFDRYSYVCTYIKNIKDVDIDEEYNRLINSCDVEELDEKWMLKYRRNG